MRKLAQRLDKLLLHPWTTRIGAIQAVIAAALLAGGLTGGTVTLVFGFATVWAILVATGAALLAAGGTATAIERYRERKPEPPECAEVREALAAILEELEHHGQLILDTSGAEVWWERDRTLVIDCWQAHGPTLAHHGLGDAHWKCREAYREIDSLNWMHRDAWERYDRSSGLPNMSANSKVVAEKAAERIQEAIDAVGDADPSDTEASKSETPATEP